MKENTKSDVPAKKAYASLLERAGFTNVQIVASPSDIIAEKDGQQWFFEIKKTNHSDKCFGAATVTEWEQAIRTPERFRFIVAISDDGDETFTFREYTPSEFMAFSTVPPFKIYFNIDFSGKTRRPARKLGKRKAAVRLSGSLVHEMVDIFNRFRNS